MRALCLTLDPENPLRAQRAVKEISRLGFDVKLVSGIDGYSLSNKRLKESLTPRAWFELQNGRYVHEGLSSPGAVGCYLAHVKAWEIAAAADSPVTIFEDDFVSKREGLKILVTGLKDLLKIDFDVCRLQHRPNPDLGETLISIPNTTLSKVVRTEGLTAYIIHPRAAKILLSSAFPIDCQVDHYLDFACAYHGLTSVCLRKSIYNDPKIPSTIRHNTLEDPRCKQETCIVS